MYLLTMGALVLALCSDSFVASLALGADGVRIPPAAVGIISGISAGFLALSMGVGQLLQPLLPPGVAQWIGCIILCTLGGIRLLDGGIKSLIKHSQKGQAKISFHFLNFRCILRIYADSTAADADASKTLTSTEALPLAVALSLDSLAAGLGAGLGTSLEFLVGTVILALGMSAASVAVGSALGRRLRVGTALSWLGGLLLVGLGIAKLL